MCRYLSWMSRNLEEMARVRGDILASCQSSSSEPTQDSQHAFKGWNRSGDFNHQGPVKLGDPTHMAPEDLTLKGVELRKFQQCISLVEQGVPKLEIPVEL